MKKNKNQPDLRQFIPWKKEREREKKKNEVKNTTRTLLLHFWLLMA